MRRLQNIDVLILDDFLIIGIDQRGQEYLTKIIFNRDGRLPTIVASQTSAAYWLEALPDRVGADSLVSRLNTGQRINLGDYDMRQHPQHHQLTTTLTPGSSPPTKQAATRDQPQYQQPGIPKYQLPGTPVPKHRSQHMGVSAPFGSRA